MDKKDKFTTERSQFVDTKVLENTSGLSCGGGPAPQSPGKCETNDEDWYAIKLMDSQVGIQIQIK